jgi:hypothetical protein
MPPNALAGTDILLVGVAKQQKAHKSGIAPSVKKSLLCLTAPGQQVVRATPVATHSADGDPRFRDRMIFVRRALFTKIGYNKMGGQGLLVGLLGHTSHREGKA